MNRKSIMNGIPQVDTARLIVVHGHPTGAEKVFNDIFDHRKTKSDVPRVCTFLWPEIDFFNERHPSPSTDAYILEAADRAIDGAVKGLSVCATNSQLFMVRLLRRMAEGAFGTTTHPKHELPILLIGVADESGQLTANVLSEPNDIDELCMDTRHFDGSDRLLVRLEWAALSDALRDQRDNRYCETCFRIEHDI